MASDRQEQRFDALSGFATFQIDITKPIEQVVSRHIDNAKRRAQQSGLHFSVEVPFLSPDPPPILVRDERFAVDSFQAFMEVGDAFQRLLDIEVYVRRFPFRGTRVTRERYMRFHVEAYLDETYILRERLAAFAKRTTRAYKKTNRRELVIKIEKRLLATVSALDDVIAVRGRHVHESRFDETRLRNLGAIELIERNSADPIWSDFVNEQYPRVRRYWAGWVTEMNRVIQKLLDVYFSDLHRLMFDRRRFRPPD